MKHPILLITIAFLLFFQCKDSKKIEIKNAKSDSKAITNFATVKSSEDTSKFCTEMMSLDEKEIIDGYLKKMNEFNKNQGFDEQVDGAILMPFKWKKSILKINFQGGTEIMKRRVRETAMIWQTKCNIILDFGNHARPDISISFKKGGSWSYIGNASAKYSPSMNYGWLEDDTPQQEYDRVVLHEFGHALGFIHEHQHPEAGIPWNKKAVYAYYKKMGWDKAQVDRNIFQKYASDILNYTAFDKKSIMLYSIPNSLTDGNYSVGWNTKISALDATLANIVY